jgi:hypothetical protein
MDGSQFANYLSNHIWIIALIALWTLPWKGVALWKSAQKSDLAWFVILLVINTLGILEIIYIFAINHKKSGETALQEVTGENIQKKII